MGDRPTIRYGVIYGGLGTVLLYAILSQSDRVLFGSFIFYLTVVITLLWVAIAGQSKRMSAASPMNELLSNAGSKYVKGEQESVRLPSLFIRVVLVLSGVSLFGWVINVTRLFFPLIFKLEYRVQHALLIVSKRFDRVVHAKPAVLRRGATPISWTGGNTATPLTPFAPSRLFFGRDFLAGFEGGFAARGPR